MGGRGRLSGRFELFAGAYGFTSYVSTFDLQYLVPAALSRLARLSLYVHLDLFLKRKKKTCLDVTFPQVLLSSIVYRYRR